MDLFSALSRLAPAVVIGSLAGACHPGEVSVPIVGQLSNGMTAVGQATTRSDGQGNFWVQVPGKFRCDGTYSATQPGASMVIPIACSNGRRGQAVVAIQLDGVSGSGVARLNDGTTAKFVFGNLTFEQAFGAGGKARTRPI